jgi:hypothetical protein
VFNLRLAGAGSRQVGKEGGQKGKAEAGSKEEAGVEREDRL